MSVRRPELFVGVTSWNSALFIGACLDALRSTLADAPFRVVVMDNGSTDATAHIARDKGAEVVDVKISQADALNRLAAQSDAPYTLLIHADVVMLGANWFRLCRAEIEAGRALVSPEDIGCGPLTRAFGKDMPESSLLFFETRALKRLREIMWTGRRFFSRPRLAVDFYGPHVTHRLPEKLAARGMQWRPMNVHWSAPTKEPIYFPSEPAPVWSEELAYLTYGLGNFYSLGGEITHYHNWYDRIHAENGAGPVRCDFPYDYIVATTTRFLSDLAKGTLLIPPAIVSDRAPKAL